MKKKIAIMLTLILATGTFTACTAEEKVNNDIQTSVVRTTADVSVSEKSSVATTEKGLFFIGNRFNYKLERLPFSILQGKEN